jgi:exosortase
MVARMAAVVVPRSRAGAFPWTTLMFIGFWAWAIWSCGEYWRGNPNYSYGWAVPVLALGFGLRRSWMIAGPGPVSVDSPTILAWPMALILGLIAGPTVFALEFARQQIWHPQLVLMAICLGATLFSFAVFYQRGGLEFFRAELFPVLFFLTAVPWPARLEQPVTSTLMRWVAAGTAELLHWLGVEAQTSGGAIALRSGLVGITEACSGIRSLQAGIMFGLALGEWFLLRPARRVWLLVIAIAAALLTNLARTLALSLQAEWHGVGAVEQVHDLIGNVTITALIVGIWIAGKLLAPRKLANPPLPWSQFTEKGRAILTSVISSGRRELAPIFIACLTGLIAARILGAVIEARDQTQVAPFFVARVDQAAGDQPVPVPKEIWNELRPTSGEYLRRHDESLPRGLADFYHFFWKPSPWNRFALIHRPDICMPGVGWEARGAPEPVDVDFDGRSVRFYAFRFQRGEYHALQMWGVWRNGEPISLDYQVAQVQGDAVPPPALQLEGKRRSATEIVACSLFSEQSAPQAEIAVALLRSVFKYKPQ